MQNRPLYLSSLRTHAVFERKDWNERRNGTEMRLGREANPRFPRFASLRFLRFTPLSLNFKRIRTTFSIGFKNELREGKFKDWLYQLDLYLYKTGEELYKEFIRDNTTTTERFKNNNNKQFFFFFCTRFKKLLSLSQKDKNHYGPIHTKIRLLSVFLLL